MDWVWLMAYMVCEFEILLHVVVALQEKTVPFQQESNIIVLILVVDSELLIRIIFNRNLLII